VFRGRGGRLSSEHCGWCRICCPLRRGAVGRSTIPDLARRATALWWWRNWAEQEFFLPCPPSVALAFDDEARLFEAGDGSARGSELGVGELGGPSAVEIGREVGNCGARVIPQVAQDFALEAA
jgi:hypothetical protein